MSECYVERNAKSPLALEEKGHRIKEIERGTRRHRSKEIERGKKDKQESMTNRNQENLITSVAYKN